MSKLKAAVGDYEKNYNEEEEIILQPIDHLTNAPMRVEGMQGMMYESFDHWFNVSNEQRKEIESLGTNLLSAIYTMDDVVDNSLKRRGVLAGHVVFGKARTIYSFIYAVVERLNNLSKLKKFKLWDDYVKLGAEMSFAQVMEIEHINNVTCPTEEEYTLIAKLKFSNMVSFTFSLLQDVTGKYQHAPFEKIAEQMGILFQIYNDYINFTSPGYKSVKSITEDIKRGIFTYPIIHAVRTYPEDQEILNILKMKTSDKEIAQQFINKLEKLGSFDYTFKKIMKIKKEMEEELNNLGGNPQLQIFLNFAVMNINTLTM